ncbi:hypothetical protein GCM10007939_14470 [Amylibacter marinus]|uniref:Uncharacterized protein n=1 Tax=Amylibacter marinus TaxID=1475483 RepID=A0ABQ5VVJ7_9RHOB|nr:hypothetical protein GCM10007939_14470 [Amylibacter marinus]
MAQGNRANTTNEISHAGNKLIMTIPLLPQARTIGDVRGDKALMAAIALICERAIQK